MDKISVVGLTLGIAALIMGQVIEGGHIASLLQPTAFLIVIGGTLGAVMLQSPLKVFREGMRMTRWVFVPPPASHAALIRQATSWSQIARKEGLLALEAQIPRISDSFTRKGLQLLVDGVEPQRLREVLEVEIDAWAAQMRQGARIWEAAGGYAPTLGILGAVLGLIHVMENLTDPSKLGAGIAVAFVATVYGVGFANLVFLPMSKKLMAYVADGVSQREMLVDGLVGIANGDNPRIIESRMQGYIA
ncbi:flagellar motor protein [Aromatoleum evansii]|uniref:Flagellar motor protein n=1 Tax=Aromatoleum evansii TaxID=59406 RepID=A0ABZ1ALW4_AROEV|nr:flagellar motor protein [Aromatoleum evansii]NMG32455.1 flagellar motor protein [Aromatoleum evansii]WRL45446.1 flagellar motor protein [Aromatoleum evansii]